MSSSNQRSISKSSDNLDLDIIYLYSRFRPDLFQDRELKIILFFIFYFHHTQKYVLDSSIQISSNLSLIKNNILAISLLVLRIFQKIQLYKICIKQSSCAQHFTTMGFFINFGTVCSPCTPSFLLLLFARYHLFLFYAFLD